MATRRERVVLELEDNFTSGMARAAASAALLNKELDSLSKDSVRTRRSMSDIDQPTQNIGRSAGSSAREVDKLSGRMRILADVTSILGPGLIAVGAAGVPAIAGVAAQLGFAATGAGVALLAFQGVGDALKAVNKAALEPTAQNLEAARLAMDAISPSAQAFVNQIRDMVPELHHLRDVAADGLFPGLTKGLVEVEAALPRVERIISSVSTELGNIAADAGGSLASDRWAPFLNFIADEAPSALADMAKAAGNTAHAVAELWMATDPLNDDFSTWLVNATADIDRWAGELSKTQGFADFLAYVETTGPKVAEAFGAIANAAIQILQAAAPLGGPVLEGIKALADVVAKVADSDLGTPLFTAVAGLALFNRTLAITSSIQKTTFGGPALTAVKGYGASIRGLGADMALLNRQTKLVTLPGKTFIGPLTQAQTALTRVRASAATLGKSAALVGGLAIASSGAADKIGLTNTASLALMGSLAGPWGAAIGGAVGATIDLTHANDGLEDAIKRVNLAAKSGDFTEMSAGLKVVKKQLDDIEHTTGVGDFLSDTGKKIGDGLSHPLDFHPGDERKDRAREAIREAEAARAAFEKANREKAKSRLIGDGYAVTARNLDAATQSAKSFSDALTKINNTLSKRGAAREYQAALDDFRKSLKENGKTLDINTEKGRNNQAALDRIAQSTADLAEKISNPVLRAEFLDSARKQFIKAAIEAGKTRTEARNLADQLIGLDKLDPKINIQADTGQAVSATVALKRLVDSLHDRNIHINVTKSTNATLAEADVVGADGITVPGQRSPYGDKVLAYLAPGEEVISNRFGQADRYRDVLKAINANRYANGGTVRPFTSGGGGFGIDYDRLASAVTGDRLMAHRGTRDALLSAFRTALSEAPVQRVPRDLTYGMAY